MSKLFQVSSLIALIVLVALSGSNGQIPLEFYHGTWNGPFCLRGLIQSSFTFNPDGTFVSISETYADGANCTGDRSSYGIQTGTWGTTGTVDSITGDSIWYVNYTLKQTAIYSDLAVAYYNSLDCTVTQGPYPVFENGVLVNTTYWDCPPAFSISVDNCASIYNEARASDERNDACDTLQIYTYSLTTVICDLSDISNVLSETLITYTRNTTRECETNAGSNIEYPSMIGVLALVIAYMFS